MFADSPLVVTGEVLEQDPFSELIDALSTWASVESNINGQALWAKMLGIHGLYYLLKNRTVALENCRIREYCTAALVQKRDVFG